MNTDRMNHMITVLEGVIASNKAFNLSGWVMNAETAFSSDAEYVKHHWNTVGDVEKTCGTSACAMGYAALDPEFRSQGLVVEIHAHEEQGCGNYVKLPAANLKEFNEISRRPDLEIDEVYVKFEGVDGVDAAAAFFEIEEFVASWLFLSDHYGMLARNETVPVTPQAVIARIRAVIASGGQKPEQADA